MAELTKNTKPRADYHTWAASEITDGDIIGVYESLGRGAKTVVIESIGGATTIRLNVSKKIYKSHESLNPWLNGAWFPPSPILIDEIEDTSKDDIIISSDDTWSSLDYPITDIKIITKSSGLKITIT